MIELGPGDQAIIGPDTGLRIVRADVSPRKISASNFRTPAPIAALQ